MRDLTLSLPTFQEKPMPNASDQTILRSTIFALMLLLVAGCAATKTPGQDIVPDALLKEDEGIVFGILTASSYDSKGDKLAGVDIDYVIRFGSSSSRLEQQFQMLNIERMFRGNTSTPRLFALVHSRSNFVVRKGYSEKRCPQAALRSE
jgi:hypothetical protein